MKKLTRWSVAATAAALAAVLTCVADVHAAVAAAARNEGVDIVSAYAGTWKVEITHLHTPSGRAREEGRQVMTVKNDCWRNAEFSVCHQNVDGDSKALLVFACSVKDGAYATYPIALGADTVHRGTLIIQGNTWTFPWEETEHGKTTYFRIINVFTSLDTIEYRAEYSVDRVHWVQAATGWERRVSRTTAG